MQLCLQNIKQVLNGCWPARAMVVEGVNVKDIFYLVPPLKEYTYL